MTASDEALMRSVREGDLSKLGFLFDRYHLVLFEFLSRMTGNRHAAEDLVQEVFVRILKYRASYRDEAGFRAWVYRIARNAQADYYAKRDRAVPLSEEAMERPDRNPGPESQIESEREAALLRAALLELREDRRELIVLARYQEMKHEAIASLLGIDTTTVKVRIYRALKELRETFLRLSEKPSCNAKTSQPSLRII
jgi:RNA polymerase sigma factor (sigma-70 family)